MRTKVIWLVIGVGVGLLASEALARTLTSVSAGSKALEFARSQTPVPGAQVGFGSNGCKRVRRTVNGEQIDDPHKVRCEVRMRRQAVDRLGCVEVTMRHRRDALGRATYPVSARFVTSTTSGRCPGPQSAALGPLQVAAPR